MPAKGTTNSVSRTCEECNKEFLVRPSRVAEGYGRFCSRECYTAHRKTRVQRTCPVCGTEFFADANRVERGWGIFCSKKCRGKSISDSGHPYWKGGRIIDTDGYVQIRVNGRYVYEHRYVMEQHLGRPLLTTEHVHHRPPGDKTDNRLENLEILTPTEHQRVHHSGIPHVRDKAHS